MAPMTTVPGVRFVPNAITVLSFSTGLTSIVFASQGRWMLAMWMIAASTVLDSLDGPAARLLQSSSRVGAELDSLSDLSAFGICPAVLIFFWQSTVNNVSEDELWLVWGSCLVYAACTALRLARFNSLLGRRAAETVRQAVLHRRPVTAGCAAGDRADHRLRAVRLGVVHQ